MALSTNSGFGGINVALLLRNWDHSAALTTEGGPEIACDEADIVLGAGWIDGQEYGGVRKGRRVPYSPQASLSTLWRTDPVFTGSTKDFGRFEPVARLAYYAVGLALDDAGVDDSWVSRRDIGLIGTNEAGCCQSNLHYFSDYVQAGRRIARGGLFVHTLPSSPFAEAAIAYGIRGPLLYVTRAGAALPAALRTAADMLRDSQARAMLVAWADEDEAACLVLAPQAIAGHGGLCSAGEAVRVAERVRHGRDVAAAIAPGAPRVERANT